MGTIIESLPNETQMGIAVHSILWCGFVLPGHEFCQLFSKDSKWHLKGTSVFSHDGMPCQMVYLVICIQGWHTISAGVEGWVGEARIIVQIRTDSNQKWWLNRIEVPELMGCMDLDFNFSPATNTIPICRLNLAVGETDDINAAWLRFPGFTLEPLTQRYHRLAGKLYRYESGNGMFVADLLVNHAGFVIDYPGIWEAQTTSD
jgi:hypothetical protein